MNPRGRFSKEHVNGNSEPSHSLSHNDQVPSAAAAVDTPSLARRPHDRSPIQGLDMRCATHLHCAGCGSKVRRDFWGLANPGGGKHRCGVGILDVFGCVTCAHPVLELPNGRRVDWLTSRQHVCEAWAR